MSDTPLDSLADTALWVAVFRARESRRPDALFRDPLAAQLAGDRGFELVDGPSGAPQTSWSVAIRTVVIDELVTEAVARGADTVLSLGAGLDARPYRLDLPAGLRWFEVDYPQLVALKEQRLAGEVPRCRVERVGLDLARREDRRALFGRIAATSPNVLVLTEGLVPYLSGEEVATLADDLFAQPSFSGWVIDYLAPELVRALQGRSAVVAAPLRFAPADWHAFFAEHGWRATQLRYLADASERLGREMPYPAAIRQVLGYTLLERGRSA